jgi:hypothetical protein
MSDAKLLEAWRVLEPEERRRVRLEEAVVERWEARSRSLAVEWLDLLRARPLVNGAWAMAALMTVLVATPVGALWGLVPRAVSGQLAAGAVAPARALARVAAGSPARVAAAHRMSVGPVRRDG